VIYTVAVGDPRAVGEDVLDEQTLRTVASTTGGLYSFAADRAQLDTVYQRLDALQTHKAQTVSYRPKREIYYWPLGIGLFLTLCYHAGVLLTDRFSRHGRDRQIVRQGASLILSGVKPESSAKR
jgi:Ca-activated chloride channel family protein